jgi:putative inorganic carbon (HCO3(-)) transporter
VWLALVAGLPLVFGPMLNDTFALPKVTWLRIGALLLAAAAASRALTRGRATWKSSPWTAAVAALLVAAAASVYSADFPGAGFWGLPGFFVDGWTTLAAGAFLFFYAARSLSPADDALTVRAMTAAAGIAAAYALAQGCGFDLFLWRRDQAVFGRPWSTFGNPNYLGAFLAMTLPLLVHRVATAPGAANVAAAALALAALPFTSSQAAWLGAAVGLCVWGGFATLERTARRPRWSAVAAALCLGAISFGAAASWRAYARGRAAYEAPRHSRRLTIELHPAGSAFLGRLHLWKAAWGVWKEHPWTGAGPDGFVYAFKRHADPRHEEALGQGVSSAYAHNSVLNTAATLGSLGLAAYLWLAALALRAAFRPRAGPAPSEALPRGALAAALAAVWVNNQLSFHSVTTAAYAWILLGWLARSDDGPPVETVLDETDSFRRTARAAAWALAAAGTFFFAGLVRANRLHRLAEDAFASGGDWRGAAARSVDAVRRDPFTSAYRLYLARMYQEGIFAAKPEDRLKFAHLSLTEYQRVASATPRDALAQNGMGVSYIRRELARGTADFRAAERCFLAALEADPFMAEARSNLANTLYLQGRREEALAEYRRLADGRPDVKLYRLGLGDLLAAEGRAAEAVAEWQKILRKEPDDPDARERLKRLWEANP